MFYFTTYYWLKDKYVVKHGAHVAISSPNAKQWLGVNIPDDYKNKTRMPTFLTSPTRAYHCLIKQATDE